MRIETKSPQIGADDFARRFARRAGNLMWFLGAGASAAAGIPTAWDMVWEFKQLLFISQRRVSPRTVADLANPAVREQLQAHIDSSRQLPQLGTSEEYAALFEAVYPAEADRQAYLNGHGSWDETARAALALSKMNWNNDALYDPLPVTMSYAKVLARVVKRMPGLGIAPYQFRFFM